MTAKVAAEVLGVDTEGASAWPSLAALSARYRAVAAKVHPDVGGTAEQMHQLNEALAVLRPLCDTQISRDIKGLSPVPGGAFKLVKSTAQLLREERMALPCRHGRVRAKCWVCAPTSWLS